MNRLAYKLFLGAVALIAVFEPGIIELVVNNPQYYKDSLLALLLALLIQPWVVSQIEQ
jgi:hypothetical protein